jgi:hypothetical protein
MRKLLFLLALPLLADQTATVCASGCDVTGTMPTTVMTPFVYAYNSSGTTSVDMDFFAMNVTGLTR